MTKSGQSGHPVLEGGQPGLAASNTNRSSETPLQKATENKDQDAKVIYLDCFKLQKNPITYILEVSHSGNES